MTQTIHFLLGLGDGTTYRVWYDHKWSRCPNRTHSKKIGVIVSRYNSPQQNASIQISSIASCISPHFRSNRHSLRSTSMKFSKYSFYESKALSKYCCCCVVCLLALACDCMDLKIKRINRYC